MLWRSGPSGGATAARSRISCEVAARVGVAVESGIDFVASADIEAAALAAGLDAARIAVATLAFPRGLPHGAPVVEGTPVAKGDADADP